MTARVRRDGVAEIAGEALVSPVRGVRCVFYSVELTDPTTRAVLASERDGVPFHIVATGGRRVAIDPRNAALAGFFGFNTLSRPETANAEVVTFATAKKVRDPEKRVLRLVEQTITVGARVHAEGVLEVAASGNEPYRAPSADGAVERFAARGLSLSEDPPLPTMPRWSRVALIVCVVACVGYLGLQVWTGIFPRRHVPPRGPEDCGRGERYQASGLGPGALCCPETASCD